ncbi:alpha/beta-hydrolase [Hortaea werneckii]|nr:alpha/beta-hydrolase [Hortaea werneckii]
MTFTPEVLLSAPRRSAGVPNPSGTKVLYTTSTYDFQAHKKTIELRVLDIKSSDSHQLAKDDDVSDFNWLDEDTFVCLQPEEDGSTSVYVASVSKCMQKIELGNSHYIAGKINASASDLKVAPLDENGEEFAIVLSAQACPDGSLFTTEKANKKTHSTGRLYSSLFVRHWDHYVEPQRNSLWCGQLKKDDTGKYGLSELTNMLKGSKLECPVPPFGGTDSFDVSPRGIIFVAKDPELNSALNTKCNVYIIRVKDWKSADAMTLKEIMVPGFEGAASCPVLDASGGQAAFLKMKTNGYEADRNTVFELPSGLGDGHTALVARQVSFETSKSDSLPNWDGSPQSITFSADGGSWYLVAEDEGYTKLYHVTIDFGSPKGLRITPLIQEGSVNQPWSTTPITPFWNTELPHGRRRQPGRTPNHPQAPTNPKINEKVHSLVMKPSTFDESKKYPVAYLIHGGPQGSWADSWSTRWNPAVYAEQGYIVVCPNPTGSTGYGQAFTDAIRRNWGGDPYEDIVKCFEWVGKNMPEADNEKAVALGASYGGYMMNWIQGHDLGRKFKALVCHDGIFSFSGGLLATEELYFPFHDLGGTPWYDPGFKAKQDPASVPAQGHNNFGGSTPSDWRKWDPSEYLTEWKTPQLVIHSSKDYRLTISEGLAAFNVLQARGVESEFLCFPDENHWVLKPENSLAWHKVVLNWINKYVGLSPYTDEDPQSEEFWGGLRREDQNVENMPGMGKPET